MLHRSAGPASAASVTRSHRRHPGGSGTRVRRRGGFAIALVGLVGGYLVAPAVVPDGWFGRVAVSSVSARDGSGNQGARSVPPSAAPASGSSSGGPTTTAAPAVAPPDEADLRAGLMSMSIPPVGAGALDVVPGSVVGPGLGPVRSVRVEVEQDLAVDGPAFAAFVMATLNDPRSWGLNGRMTFARTDGAAEIRVVLASATTVDKLCAPVDTKGVLSCGHDGMAALNFTGWVAGLAAYGADRTAYRQYLVNSEVGLLLGHPHVECPGAGQRAPVMQQQTIAVTPCTPNAWPFPDGA
jgi:hypothetical protein